MAPWISSLVWTDYRLAVIFTVLIPLALLVWSFVQQSDALQRLMVIYWRVASLLMISTYLLIGAVPIGYLSGWLARILIPLSLWYWIDLNDEIRDQPPGPLKLLLMAWRWAVTIYCGVGAILQLPMLKCAFLSSQQVTDTAQFPLCQLWLQPTWAYKEWLHPTTKPWFLGILGIVGLTIYALYLGYFIFFRLNKRKRSAIEQ